MKAKVLLVPLTVLIAVGFFIGFVYPAFSNGSDGVLENYNILEEEQAKLNKIRDKNKNITGLSSQLDSLAEKERLYDFMPEEIREEVAVNNLTNLVYSSSLFLSNIKIDQVEKNNISQRDYLGGYEDIQNPMEILAVLPKAKKFTAEIKLAGSYDNIKKFLIILEKLNQNNNFVNLKINSNNEVVSTEELPSEENGLLAADASIEFSFLKKAKMNEAIADNPVFSNEKLETKIISEINEQRITNSFEINIGQKGKNNLFQK